MLGMSLSHYHTQFWLNICMTDRYWQEFIAIFANVNLAVEVRLSLRLTSKAIQLYMLDVDPMITLRFSSGSWDMSNIWAGLTTTGNDKTLSRNILWSDSTQNMWWGSSMELADVIQFLVTKIDQL